MQEENIKDQIAAENQRAAKGVFIIPGEPTHFISRNLNDGSIFNCSVCGRGHCSLIDSQKVTAESA